jgi:hypothetical protein
MAGGGQGLSGGRARGKVAGGAAPAGQEVADGADGQGQQAGDLGGFVAGLVQVADALSQG